MEYETIFRKERQVEESGFLGNIFSKKGKFVAEPHRPLEAKFKSNPFTKVIQKGKELEIRAKAGYQFELSVTLSNYFKFDSNVSITMNGIHYGESTTVPQYSDVEVRINFWIPEEYKASTAVF